MLGRSSPAVLLGTSESHSTRNEPYKLEMLHRVLYYKAHGHGNQKKAYTVGSYATLLCLAFDPEAFFEASLSSRSSRSSIFLFLFLCWLFHQRVPASPKFPLLGEYR